MIETQPCKEYVVLLDVPDLQGRLLLLINIERDLFLSLWQFKFLVVLYACVSTDLMS